MTFTFSAETLGTSQSVVVELTFGEIEDNSVGSVDLPTPPNTSGYDLSSGEEVLVYFGAPENEAAQFQVLVREVVV